VCRIVSAADATIECRACGEINRQDTLECARCGASLLSAEQLRDHRANIERWKREAERESVDYPTLGNQVLDRLSGKPQTRGAYFGSISNYRKRVGLLCLLVPMVIVVLLYAISGR
jgi:hypothetical protein